MEIGRYGAIGQHAPGRLGDEVSSQPAALKGRLGADREFMAEPIVDLSSDASSVAALIVPSAQHLTVEGLQPRWNPGIISIDPFARIGKWGR